MKKLFWTACIVLGLYLAAAFVAWRLLPDRIHDADRRLFGVRVAIAQLMHDQAFVSDRVKAITDETLGRGKNKLAEVTELLADPDLNHIALTYLGSDWSLQRSAFLGQIAHTRGMLAMQKDARKKTKSRLDEKIKELESRKSELLHRMRTPSPLGREHEDPWRIELEDIDRQLAEFRGMNTYKQNMTKDLEDSNHIEASARNEDALYKLATDYQASTVGALNEVLAARLTALRWEENAPVRWRMMGSWFNIWPFNRVMKLPLGGDDEKRL